MDIVTGNGPVESKKKTGVVLIHGLTGTPVEMKPLEKHLKKLGVDVENVLLAGHGGSNADVIASTWQQWLQSARDGVKAILSRNEKVIICGLSMGSLLASIIAAEESRVAGVVICSPTLFYDGSVLDNSLIDWVYASDIPRNVMKSMVRILPLLGKTFYWEELPPYGIRDQRIQRQITKSIEAAKIGGTNEFGVFRTYYGPLVEMLDMVEVARKSFSKIKVPVLQLHSLDDTIASIHNSTETYLRLASNNKLLFLMTGCDHVMTLDLQRQLVHKMIGRFVEAYSEKNNQQIRSVLAPVLSEAKFAKGGTINAMVSPEMHGLSKEEWKAVYPSRRFAHLASVSDVHQLHSIVLRDAATPIMSLPVFIGEYGQSMPLAATNSLWRVVSNLMAPQNATVFGIGSMVDELPDLGINATIGSEAKSKAYSHLIRIIESLGKSGKVDAFSSVLQSSAELPKPAMLLRANDNKALRINEEVQSLLEGKQVFSHRNILRNSLTKFIQIALPAKNSQPEPMLYEATATAG